MNTRIDTLFAYSHFVYSVFGYFIAMRVGVYKSFDNIECYLGSQS